MVLIRRMRTAIHIRIRICNLHACALNQMDVHATCMHAQAWKAAAVRL